MAMQNPPHPGGAARRQCLEPLGLTVTRAAREPGVSRQVSLELGKGRAGISMEMAVRLPEAFGSMPERWRGMQMARDRWQADGRAGGYRGGAFRVRVTDPLRVVAHACRRLNRVRLP